MSGSPPPFDQETRNETEVEVDLSSNQLESKLDDNDLFFFNYFRSKFTGKKTTNRRYG
jgi:hypothetical protein